MQQEKGVGWNHALVIGVFVIALMFAIGVGITGNSIFDWFFEEELPVEESEFFVEENVVQGSKLGDGPVELSGFNEGFDTARSGKCWGERICEGGTAYGYGSDDSDKKAYNEAKKLCESNGEEIKKKRLNCVSKHLLSCPDACSFEKDAANDTEKNCGRGPELDCGLVLIDQAGGQARTTFSCNVHGSEYGNVTVRCLDPKNVSSKNETSKKVE